MADPLTLRPAGAFETVLESSLGAIEAAGVFARPMPNLRFATVLARKGQMPALAERVSALYGLELPQSPRRVASGELAFVATGPGVWLAVGEAADPLWPETLAAGLEGLASVSDQSDGYAAIRLEGPAVLDLLAKGVFLDLHPAAFPVGSAAGVSIAHMGVILWRREAEVFELLCFRSYAASFSNWIQESAAEYGLAVLPAAL